MNPIQKLKVIFGSYSAVGAAFGVSGEAVRKWEQHGVPAERVMAIEEATDFEVSRHELRPDLYPEESWCRCPACERRHGRGEDAA